MKMDTTTDQLKTLLDREQIRERIARLARGEDRRSADIISSCYWPDATTDYGVFQGTFKQYLDWVVPGSEAIKNTQHVLGQSVIDLEWMSALAQRARAETQVLSYHRVDMGQGDLDTLVGGRYLDIFEKRGADWRIVSRTMLYDWYQDWGKAIDWSKGVMGLPFTADHYPGRAVGDYSERFFTQK
jgi:hypothetical protein